MGKGYDISFDTGRRIPFDDLDFIDSQNSPFYFAELFLYCGMEIRYDTGEAEELNDRICFRRYRMFDFDGDGIMDPGEEYLAFRIWEEECLAEEEAEEFDAWDEEEEV